MDKERNECPSVGNYWHKPIEIHHSRKRAIAFALLIVVVAFAIIAMTVYLKNQSVYSFISIPIIVIFLVIFLCGFHVVKHLLIDAGKIAICIGHEGVKFNRYNLIGWADIEDVSFVEDDNGADTLWLTVKKGVEFFPKGGSRPSVWLATVAGLQRSIDISGYGRLTLSDEEIRALICRGIKEFRDKPTSS